MRLVGKVKLTSSKRSKIPTRVSAETGQFRLADGIQKIPFQSTFERGFIEICDFAPEVRQIRWEPFTLRFKDLVLDRFRTYTPDFSVETVTRDSQRFVYIVEIKRHREYEHIRKEPEGKEGRKWIAASAWCRDQPACDFVVCTDRWLEQRGLANVRLIIAKATYPIANDLASLLLGNLLTISGVNLSRLIDLGMHSGFEQPIIISTVMALCSADKMHFDIRRPLDTETVFHAGPRERIFQR